MEGCRGRSPRLVLSSYVFLRLLLDKLAKITRHDVKRDT